MANRIFNQQQMNFTVGLMLALTDAAPCAHTVQQYATSGLFRILCDNQVIKDPSPAPCGQRCGPHRPSMTLSEPPLPLHMCAPWNRTLADQRGAVVDDRNWVESTGRMRIPLQLEALEFAHGYAQAVH